MEWKDKTTGCYRSTDYNDRHFNSGVSGLLSVLNIKFLHGWFIILHNPCVELESSFHFLGNIYSEHPLQLLGGHKQSYFDNEGFLGLLPLVRRADCLFWLELSVWSGVWSGDCDGPEEGLMAGLEFWVAVGASVFVWRGTTIGGCSFGLRPLFLPEVAPFLTSALIPLVSITLVLLLVTTWLVAARNQF